MITYVKLKNFLSYKDITFDFHKKANMAKKLAIVYGENGSGKSNFTYSLYFLSKSIGAIASLDSYDRMEKLLDDINKEDSIPTSVIATLISQSSFNRIMEVCRMIDCDEPSYAEYGFVINGIEGYYSITFKESVISEELYYLGKTSRTNLFSINYSETDKINKKFSSCLFSANDYKKEMSLAIDKYWGKNTFLSILENELLEKNVDYIIKNLNNNVIDVIEEFEMISVFCDSSSTKIENSNYLRNTLSDFSEGEISVDQLDLLHKTEYILNSFFTQTFPNIKSVKYKISEKENVIRYQLIFEKMIAGKIRTIPFVKESSGTKSVLKVFNAIWGIFDGDTVVYDEIDDKIHDVLLGAIFMSLQDQITGQLIVTTHNTYLMETNLPENIYIISVDYLGNKEVNCVSDYGISPSNTNNIRSLYLKGMLGGISFVDNVNYDKIIYQISHKEV